MTIQWTLVATFLYLELAFIFLLILPIISPKVWQCVFQSRVFRLLADKADVYFTVFIIVLIFFFVDSIREMLNYSSKTPIDLGQELQIHLKLFRSQRNYYISGFTVFLWLVIRRLVMLVLHEADLLSENESAMKRAQNATETVEKIMRRKEEIEREKSVITQVSIMEANELRKSIEEKENELEIKRKAVEDMKERSLSVKKEYEDLLEKHAALLNEIKNREEKAKKEAESKVVENVDEDEDEEISDVEEESESTEEKEKSRSDEEEDLSST